MFYPDCYKHPKLISFIREEIEFNPVEYHDVSASMLQSFADRLLLYVDVTEELLNHIAENPHIMMHPLRKYMRTSSKEYCYDLSEALSAATSSVCTPIIKDIYDELYADYMIGMNLIEEDEYDIFREKTSGDIVRLII